MNTLKQESKRTGEQGDKKVSTKIKVVSFAKVIST